MTKKKQKTSKNEDNSVNDNLKKINSSKNVISPPISSLLEEFRNKDLLSKPLIDFQYSDYLKDINIVSKNMRTLQESFKNGVLNNINDSKISIDSQIIELKKQLSTATKKFKEEQNNREEIQKINADLEEKQKSSHIINRIHPLAADKYLKSNEFKKNFEDGNEVNSVVVSIDIRRSTDLMLKAKSPTKYSDFITTLSQKLSSVIIEHLGVFDKFTGDGILAFFPDFYSGDEAVLLAIMAAEECHKVFQEHYKEYRNKFTVHIKDVGLGIGIDYGKVSIVNTSSELTVVGRPVVYACRFSGAKAGDTLLNIEAFEQVESTNHPMVKEIEESEIFIKNEGNALAFKIKIDKSKYAPNNDYPWDHFTEDYYLVDNSENKVGGEENPK